MRLKLAEIRKAAGLSQRALSRRLGRENSFIGKIEQGERRIDAIELYWICEACGRKPLEVVGEIYEAFHTHHTKPIQHPKRRKP